MMDLEGLTVLFRYRGASVFANVSKKTKTKKTVSWDIFFHFIFFHYWRNFFTNGSVYGVQRRTQKQFSTDGTGLKNVPWHRQFAMPIAQQVVTAQSQVTYGEDGNKYL